MSAVRTYKALDYDMKLYGFWPADLVVVTVVFVVIHGVFNSLPLDLVTVGPALAAAWRARKRPPRHGSSLLSFILTPDRYAIGCESEEIPQ